MFEIAGGILLAVAILYFLPLIIGLGIILIYASVVIAILGIVLFFSWGLILETVGETNAPLAIIVLIIIAAMLYYVYLCKNDPNLFPATINKLKGGLKSTVITMLDGIYAVIILFLPGWLVVPIFSFAQGNETYSNIIGLTFIGFFLFYVRFISRKWEQGWWRPSQMFKNDGLQEKPRIDPMFDDLNRD